MPPRVLPGAVPLETKVRAGMGSRDSLFGGVRVGMTLSVIGVVVVELLWADRGLGFLLNFARGQLDTPLMFATVATLSVMAISLYLIVVMLERVLIRWRRKTP